jgi:hypothetical protein
LAGVACESSSLPACAAGGFAASAKRREHAMGSRATATIAHATESRRVTMPLMVT